MSRGATQQHSSHVRDGDMRKSFRCVVEATLAGIWLVESSVPPCSATRAAAARDRHRRGLRRAGHQQRTGRELLIGGWVGGGAPGGISELAASGGPAPPGIGSLAAGGWPAGNATRCRWGGENRGGLAADPGHLHRPHIGDVRTGDPPARQQRSSTFCDRRVEHRVNTVVGLPQDQHAALVDRLLVSKRRGDFGTGGWRTPRAGGCLLRIAYRRSFLSFASRSS
jgi:hypothetical protein